MSQAFLKALPESLRGRIRTEEPMAPHTSFRIGGPADYYFEPTHTPEMLEVIRIARQAQLPVTVIGNGSNLLVSDLGIRGLVIALGRAYAGIEPLVQTDEAILDTYAPEWRSVCETYPHTPLYAEFGAPPQLFRVRSGTSLISLAAYARSRALAGLAFACGIPGSVGGAVYMNAGAYGNSIQDVVVVTQSMSWDGKLFWVCGPAHDFDYRSSYFSKAGQIILESYFCLRPGREAEVKAQYEDYKARRLSTQPLEWPSAGSMFKRPRGYFAGKLISDAGLKGFRVGDAAVSEKHAGFVVNLGHARAEEVRTLVETIQRRVFEMFAVELEPEVRFIGDWDRPIC